MASQRSLLKKVWPAVAGRRHRCKANAKHQIAKGDPILAIKVERNEYHYCRECALKFIANARESLVALENGLAPPPT